MKEVKSFSTKELETLKRLMDETSFMQHSGALTSYGFLLSDYIRAKTNMTTLQDVLTQRYEREDKLVH